MIRVPGPCKLAATEPLSGKGPFSGELQLSQLSAPLATGRCTATLYLTRLMALGLYKARAPPAVPVMHVRADSGRCAPTTSTLPSQVPGRLSAHRSRQSTSESIGIEAPGGPSESPLHTRAGWVGFRILFRSTRPESALRLRRLANDGDRMQRGTSDSMFFPRTAARARSIKSPLTVLFGGPP